VLLLRNAQCHDSLLLVPFSFLLLLLANRLTRCSLALSEQMFRVALTFPFPLSRLSRRFFLLPQRLLCGFVRLSCSFLPLPQRFLSGLLRISSLDPQPQQPFLLRTLLGFELRHSLRVS
jgi:hypothetical protein